MRRKRNQRSSFYSNTKSGSNQPKKNTNEIKSVSTNIIRQGETVKKKIINLSKPILKKDNPKKIQLDKKRPQNLKKNKIELKFKSKTPRTIIPYKMNVLENTTCQICNKTINNMSNAIFEKENEKKYHFECVTGELKKANSIRSNQRIAYIGNGVFAVIEDVKEDGRMKFKIIQKVQYSPKILI